MALENRLAAPWQVKKFQIATDLFGEFGLAPRMIDVVNPQDIAISKARSDKRRIGMAKMQQAGRAWCKPRNRCQHRGGNGHDLRVHNWVGAPPSAPVPVNIDQMGWPGVASCHYGDRWQGTG